MSTYAVLLPGSDEPVHCANEAEVRTTLEDYRTQNPKTLWSGVSIHEMPPGRTTGLERSVFDFVS
jgi:hypothetical protein